MTDPVKKSAFESETGNKCIKILRYFFCLDVFKVYHP